MVANALLECLKATTNEPHQFLLLRILAIVVPEGADISPIVALLHSDGEGEGARGAAGSQHDGIARGVAWCTPSGQCGLCGRPDGCAGQGPRYGELSILQQKLQNGAPAEQAAAARGLAASGDPALAEPLLALSKTIDINHRFTAEDAVLRLADNLVKQGGRWDAGIKLYCDVLCQSVNPVILGGALSGLVASATNP